MATIVTRASKGAPLLNTEVDANFTNLNTDKLEINAALGTPASGVVTNLTGTASININGTVGAATPAAGAFTTLAYSGTLTGGTGVMNLGSGQLFKDANGNVGIGTTAPSAKLEVNVGSGAAFFTRTAGDNGTTAPCAAIATDAATVRFGVSGDALSFRVGPLGTVPTVQTERMRITSAGNVGIGTTAPDAKLTVNGAASFAAGTAAAPSIARSSDLNTGLFFPAADTVAASTGGSERLRLTSDGKFLVGASTARSNFDNSTTSPRLQVEGTDNQTASISIVQNFSGATNGPRLMLGKSNGSSVGSNTIVGANNIIGAIAFQGNDGTEFVPAALISAEVDGTPGANDMPGRLVFSTTADGSAAPAERLRITSAGNVGIGTTSPDAKLHVEGASNLGVRYYVCPSVSFSNVASTSLDLSTVVSITNNQTQVIINVVYARSTTQGGASVIHGYKTQDNTWSFTTISNVGTDTATGSGSSNTVTVTFSNVAQFGRMSVQILRV